MVVNENSLEVQSIFLNENPDGEGLEELSKEILNEVENSSFGDVIDERFAKYSFMELVSEEGTPEHWQPEVATISLEFGKPEWKTQVKDRINVEGENIRVVDESLDPQRRQWTPFAEIGVTSNNEAKLRTEGRVIEAGVETIIDELEEVSPPAPHEEGPQKTYDEEECSVTIIPDFATGHFAAKVEFGGQSFQSTVWMPYANQDEAILVAEPSNLGESTVAEVVPVQEESHQDNYFMRGVSNTLDEYLPFQGVPQPEISSEAINYFRDPECAEPVDVQVSDSVLDYIREEDGEYARRVRDEIYKIGATQDNNMMDRVNGQNIEQVGSDDIYLSWVWGGEKAIEITGIHESRTEIYTNDSRS